MVWFNYRRVPAVALAHQIVEEGRLGKAFHYRAKYLQDWTISSELPMGGHTLWRLDKEQAGSGVTGDLLAHSIDLALWLNGPLRSVCAMTETFIKERDWQDGTGQRGPVRIDDACAFLARFANGSLGTFESTRCARGRKNQHTFEMNGQQASICFDLENASELGYYDHRDEGQLRGWRTIYAWEADHPYMKNWWVPGCAIGYEHTFINTLADFLVGLGAGVKACPDFRDGLNVQTVCDAVLASAEAQRWEEVVL